MSSNPRDDISRFVTGLADDLVEECRLTMLHNNIYIYWLMILSRQVKETKLKSKIREFDRAKTYEGGISKCRLEIQEKFRFKKRVSG